MDYSPPGSSVHWIFQARILAWVAISFSRGSSWPRDQTRVSHIAGRFIIVWATMHACMHAKSLQLCSTPCNPMDCSPPGILLCPWDSLDNNTGVGCHALLQGIFPTQGSNPGLLHLLHWQVGSLPLVPPGKPIGCLVKFKFHKNNKIFHGKYFFKKLLCI